MTIPLILASKSKPRRDILFHAGICPTIRVSHVDEDAVLARAAQEHGITVDGLPIDTKVMLLAEAKALAVSPRPRVKRGGSASPAIRSTP